MCLLYYAIHTFKRVMGFDLFALVSSSPLTPAGLGYTDTNMFSLNRSSSTSHIVY